MIGANCEHTDRQERLVSKNIFYHERSIRPLKTANTNVALDTNKK